MTRLGKRAGVNGHFGDVSHYLPAVRVTKPCFYCIDDGHQFLFGMSEFGDDPAGLAVYTWMNGDEMLFSCWRAGTGRTLPEAQAAQVNDDLPDLNSQERVYLVMLFAVSHRVANAPLRHAPAQAHPCFYVSPEMEAHLKTLTPEKVLLLKKHWSTSPFTIIVKDGSRHPAWLDHHGQTPMLATLSSCPVSAHALVYWIEEQRLQGEHMLGQLPKLVQAQLVEASHNFYALLEP